MATAHLTPGALKRMREHGHPSYWEVAVYGVSPRDTDGEGVTIECTQCGEVLIELVNLEAEQPAGTKVHCGADCGWKGFANEMALQLYDIVDLADRLDPGGTVPHGSCPKCGALCYELESP